VAIHIQRREFISTLLGGAVAASPIVACADSGKIARIGYLSPDSPSPAATALFDAFCDGLRELGWIKGKNVTVELRYAENRVERLPEIAAELVRINVDVIVGRGTLGPLAAKRATSTIPIVMAASGDPLGSGLVASLARQRAAELVDKILRGTKPADIPVEQPTKFELVINLKTANALGVTVPATLLARADKVIE
jgi:putative ABC transport system substrate-binding protein